MKDNDMTVTGFIPYEDSAIAFYLKDYQMTILDTKEMDFDSSKCMENNDGFIHCRSHRGLQLSVFVDHYKVHVNGYGRINTAIYIIGNSYSIQPVTSFSTILFRGGTLNKLFDPKALNIDLKRGEDIPVRQIDDSVKYEFATEDFHCIVSVQSNVTGKAGAEGNALQNDEVILTMQFDREQPFSTIKKHYFCIMNCLSFMTNRNNVGVDRIQLISDGKSDIEKHYFDVYVKNDKELTQKSRYRCISFSDLGESLSDLLQLLYSNENNKRKISLGFFPESDKEYGMVSNELIRSVCAAIECEARYITIDEESSNSIDELREQVKSVIKKYRKEHKGDDKITERTYGLIFGSLDYWSLSATDKAIKMYHLHEEAMQSFPLDDQDIANLIKHRNGITHDADQYISHEIAETTIKLRTLIFCCLLRRIGVSEEKIVSISRLKLNR